METVSCNYFNVQYKFMLDTKGKAEIGSYSSCRHQSALVIGYYWNIYSELQRIYGIIAREKQQVLSLEIPTIS